MPTSRTNISIGLFLLLGLVMTSLAILGSFGLFYSSAFGLFGLGAVITRVVARKIDVKRVWYRYFYSWLFWLIVGVIILW